MEPNANLAVGEDLHECPFLLDALQRVQDAPPQLLIRSDELEPEVVELLLEVVA